LDKRWLFYKELEEERRSGKTFTIFISLLWLGFSTAKSSSKKIAGKLENIFNFNVTF